jgi:hypothetical protein
MKRNSLNPFLEQVNPMRQNNRPQSNMAFMHPQNLPTEEEQKWAMTNTTTTTTNNNNNKISGKS